MNESRKVWDLHCTALFEPAAFGAHNRIHRIFIFCTWKDDPLNNIHYAAMKTNTQQEKQQIKPTSSVAWRHRSSKGLGPEGRFFFLMASWCYKTTSHMNLFFVSDRHNHLILYNHFFFLFTVSANPKNAPWMQVRWLYPNDALYLCQCLWVSAQFLCIALILLSL